VFDLGVFRVFEAYSRPDSDLREFTTPEEVPDDPIGRHLMLYVRGSGPEPAAHRIDLRPGALGDATFHYACEGLGLVQLLFGNLFGSNEFGGDELRWSHTNHNSEKRATKWAQTLPNLDPSAWDWSAVTRASSKLNRVIRTMAVSKVGAHPVLPQAAQVITQAGLQYEYGAGIHATSNAAVAAWRP
jgi:hypothetical protein